FPWGTMKTDDVPIDDSYIDFNFGENEEFRQEIMDIIITFNEEFLETYTTGSEDVFTTTTMPLQEVILEEAEFNKEQDIVFKGAFHGVDFYQDSFELIMSYDECWEINVDTITYTEEDMFLEGEKENLPETAEEIRYETVVDRPVKELVVANLVYAGSREEDKIRYEMVFDPQLKRWVVENVGYAGSMDEDKMERYKVEDTVMHTSEWDKKKKKGKKDKD